MISPLFLGAVLLQVVAFQFAAMKLSRALPDRLVGTHDLPPGVPERVAAFRRGLGRGRQIAGTTLLAAALLAGLAFPLDFHQRKLALAVISLVSTGVLLGGLIRDARLVRVIAQRAGERPLRVASLERRGLHDHYAAAWEAVPVTLFLATVVMTIVAVNVAAARDGEGARAAGHGWVIWVVPAVQVIAIAGLYALAVARAGHLGCITAEVRAYHGDPEAGLVMDEQLRRLDARQGLVSRSGVALLFGLIQARQVARIAWPAYSEPLEGLTWIVVGLMLVLFLLSLRSMARVRNAG